ncbi:MAG: helix-turn-helix domain-containing protein [Candidatus Berkelbacteria bacterium]
MKEDLIKLGFSNNEAEIYLAMIELGETGAGEIIKKTSLHRNIVYETLDKLVTKKLASKVTRKKVAQFVVTDPDRILEDQKSKLNIASKIVPSLVAKAKIKQEIVIYEGLEGFQTFSMALIEKMKENSTLYVLGATGDLWYELMADKAKKYEKIRSKKNIKFKMVEYGESRIDQERAAKDKTYIIRILPNNIASPANVLIWDDCIALQTLAEPYSVIEIKNALQAKAYMNYFNLLWDQGKEV